MFSLIEIHTNGWTHKTTCKHPAPLLKEQSKYKARGLACAYVIDNDGFFVGDDGGVWKFIADNPKYIGVDAKLRQYLVVDIRLT